MSEPFLSEIKIVSFNFPPKGWALCNGQLLPINQNQALFSLLGTTYGGNGQTTFALPNLQGRVPMHFGNGHSLGETSGEAAHTLAFSELAAHGHKLNASSGTANTGVPTNDYLARVPSFAAFATAPPNLVMSPLALQTVGGSQPHENQAPFLTLNFIIALVGIFPSRN
jgi:microcystin-dependent protein